MKVEVWLDRTSKPIVFEDVISTYQKGDMFCVYKNNTKTVSKFPLDHIWKVEESYN